MYEVTYYSLAKPTLGADDIAAILKTAREHNARNNITGCLLFHHNQFLQILEGEKQVVEKLLSKIKNDSRHSYLYILADGNKEKRTFSNWTMAFRDFTTEDMTAASEALFINNFLAFSMLADKPTHTIQSFWTRVQRLLTNDFTA